MVARRKVCMLGSFAVGKTSLVERFTQGIFSGQYLTTVGVKIDTRDIDVDGRPTKLVVWDLHGDDVFQKVRPAYVRGAAGCLFVVDGTRTSTLDVLPELRERVLAHAGPIPHAVVLNKVDLADELIVTPDAIRTQLPRVDVHPTSAKTGEGVETAFVALVRRMEQDK